MPSDSLAGHLEINGVFVLMTGLRHAQEAYMTAHGIEHDAVGEQFHADEIRLFRMETDSSHSILQFTEAGLDVPAHVIHFFHALDRELEPVQIRDQHFPLFFAGSRVIDTEFHHPALDRAKLLEVPAMVYRILGIVLRMGLAHRVDQVQIRV